MAAVALLTFLITLVIGNAFIPADESVDRHMLGHDFTAFYSAGHFASLHQFDKLYDIEAVKQFEQQTGRAAALSLGDAYGPYWNPPFYAWVFAPLSRLPYGDAILLWTLINFACLIAATVLLCRMLSPPNLSLRGANITWHSWALVPVLLVCSMPFLQAISHGQNTFTSLLLLTITVTFWRSRRALPAGLVAGLLFYKPQLGAIVAAALILTLGRRALLGLAITGVAFLFITITTMPGALAAFLTQLPRNVRFMQIEHPYLWERHATIKAFWRLLFQGRAAGEPLAIVTVLSTTCCVLLGLALVAMFMRGYQVSGIGYRNMQPSRHPTPDTRYPIPSARHRTLDRLISATIAAMPLLMPFYFDYDLMLLAIPATLFAGERLRNRKSQLANRKSAWLFRAWIALYAWLLINPGLAGRTHVNLTVPLLSAVAALLIARAAAPRAEAQPTAPPQPVDVTLPPQAAAA